jgi:hypothetical protein
MSGTPNLVIDFCIDTVQPLFIETYIDNDRGAFIESCIDNVQGAFSGRSKIAARCTR